MPPSVILSAYAPPSSLPELLFGQTRKRPDPMRQRSKSIAFVGMGESQLVARRPVSISAGTVMPNAKPVSSISPPGKFVLATSRRKPRPPNSFSIAAKGRNMKPVPCGAAPPPPPPTKAPTSAWKPLARCVRQPPEKPPVKKPPRSPLIAPKPPKPTKTFGAAAKGSKTSKWTPIMPMSSPPGMATSL